MKVQWGPYSFSSSFSVSNGVRQGSVLSPVLFEIYLDGLLEDLSVSGVGCYWQWLFAGVFCYVDDLVLLVPCASALCTMLSICSSYVNSHSLLFNESKSQLICFRKSTSFCPDFISFNGVTLSYSSSVNHLGHLLSFNLKDHYDIIRVVKDMNRKANCILHNFRSADPHILCLLFKSFCLLLYGCVLRSLSSSS